MRLHPLRQALLLALLGASTHALAVSNDEVNAGVQFSFSNPGARSLGLGGAFTGLADDATAAYANPAGLTILRTQELAFEARNTAFDTPFAASGTANFSPFDDSGVFEGSSSDSVFAPSFASWVHPADRFTIALFYHRLADFESNYSTDGIEFVGSPFGAGDGVFGVNTRLAFDVENWGAALGYQFSDSFSVGFSVAYSDFQIDSVTTRPDGLNQQTQRGDDDDIIYTLGALWRASDKFNLGLAYRRGGQFDFTAVNSTLPGNADHPRSVTEVTSFDVPHIFSAGLAFRPSDAWLFTLDVNRVYYSELTDGGVVDIFSGVPSSVSVDDGTEIRLGVEYAFLDMERPLFLRAGIWRDPDHRLSVADSALGNCGDTNVGYFDCLDGVLFAPGDDETHLSFGLGWAFPNFQVDFAADFSDLVDTYSLSGVYRF